jgi:hypothetical protein
VAKVDALFGRFPLRDQVKRQIRIDSSLSKADRQFALNIASTHSEDPNQLTAAALSVAKVKGLDQEAYALALRQAEAAVQAEPQSGFFLSTFGMAQYRTGRFAEALATLTKSEKLNATSLGASPLDIAFVAMTQHQLGRKDEAKATLARLGEVMKQPRWAKDAEAQGFLREAEALLQGKP